MKVPSHRSARGRSPVAFSLLEILVAVGILSLIIVGLLAMFYQTQRAFRSGSMQVDVLESGRAINQLLSRELQELSAAKLPGAINFAAVSYPPVVLPLTSGGTGESREYRMQELTFLTQENDDWFGTIYRIPDAGLGVGTLYRYVTNFPAVSSDLLFRTWQNVPPPPFAGFHRVAEGIVHFKVLAYDSNGLLFSPSLGNVPIGLVMTNLFNGDYDYFFRGDALPSYLDVELGVLDPRAVAQFRARTNNPVLARGYLTDHVGSIHLFKQRIPIRNAASP